MAHSYEELCEKLEEIDWQIPSDLKSSILQQLEELVATGHAEAAETLAEVLASDGEGSKSCLQEAYRWYYISFYLQGYSMAWRDENHTPPYYSGPVGDFRNEAQVSDLLLELGWETVKQLEVEASEWISKHNLQPSDEG
ncbi:hypothetical protein [Algisphaera agarilytica]|uniref:Uncharacterized protein n=1 Tax=Algisphaera agarilytica TaxID=1385975 RepID=A0A7X0LKC5_9BACT|nr:hypothetical protein [Algisphaera agarilytica]MBB6430290.1 hypothetical protein [Algisphaera agarilytica]